MGTAAERDAAVLDLERRIGRLRAEQAAIIVDVERSGTYAEDGHRNATSWLQAVLNCSRSTASGLARDARVVADLPALRAAAADVGADQVRMLSNLYADRRCRRVLPDSDQLLTRLACSLVHADFVTAIRRWRDHADPDGSHRAHVEARKGRRVATANIGHEFEMRVQGDTLAGAILTEILDEHEQAEFLHDVSKRNERYGTDATLYPLSRTRNQRRFDALVQIFLKAAATTETTNRRPLVNLVTTPEGLEHALHQFLPGAETVAGAPVDPRQLAVAAMIGDVQRIALDQTARVTSIGRRQRLFTGAARAAVLFTDRQCCYPGCPVDTALQVDHITPWPQVGGETEPNNGAATCGHHNRYKHSHRITATRDATGWHYIRPDGSEIAPRGARFDPD